jgi:hypothetical protein
MMFSADELLSTAKAETGLADFGPSDFLEGLQVLVKAINEEAGLTPSNAIEAHKFLVKTLANRLRMQRDLTRHPEILDEELLPPILITSLPRTGSTKLHRMMFASEDFSALKFWQTFNYAPFEADDKTIPDPRIAAAELYHEWMHRRSPLFCAGHPTWAEEVDEELFLLDAGFNCLFNHSSFFPVPGYVNWVLARDPRDAFVSLRRILQYAQWQHFRGMKRRFVLKSPAFLGMEAPFADVFKGADFIVTHRHPEKVIASLCTLYCGTLGLYNEGDFTGFVGPAMMMAFGETIRQHLLWRDSYPQDKVLDMCFEDVATREFDALSRVYAFLGVPFTERSRQKVRDWLQMDAARRVPSQQFDLATFGLDEATVNERFAPYIERYAKFL